MSKLDELKQFVIGLFNDATDKNTIDAVAKLNNMVSEVEKEQTTITERDADILKSYKDLIQHTTIGAPAVQTRNISAQNDIEGKERTLDIDDMFTAENIQKFLKSEQK